MWRNLDLTYLTECEWKECIPNMKVQATVRGLGVRWEDTQNQSNRHTVGLGGLCQKDVCFQARNFTSHSCAGVLY